MEETATAYKRHTYHFQDVDVILLEGIFLLKREFQQSYDLSVWIDCTFETALERALQRAQEGLPPAQPLTPTTRFTSPRRRFISIGTHRGTRLRSRSPTTHAWANERGRSALGSVRLPDLQS